METRPDQCQRCAGYRSSLAHHQNFRQAKIGQQGITWRDYPILDQDDGYTIDDVLLSEACQ